LRGLNWLGDAAIPDTGLNVAARIRSSAQPQSATVFAQGGAAKVLLHDGEYGIAAGQACVFYTNTSARARLLGGGWIERALSRSEQPEHARPGLDAAAGEPVRMRQG
jgi:tRNA-specific 2-thiouridylase